MITLAASAAVAAVGVAAGAIGTSIKKKNERARENKSAKFSADSAAAANQTGILGAVANVSK